MTDRCMTYWADKNGLQFVEVMFVFLRTDSFMYLCFRNSLKPYKYVIWKRVSTQNVVPIAVGGKSGTAAGSRRTPPSPEDAERGASISRQPGRWVLVFGTDIFAKKFLTAKDYLFLFLLLNCLKSSASVIPTQGDLDYYIIRLLNRLLIDFITYRLLNRLLHNILIVVI